MKTQAACALFHNSSADSLRAKEEIQKRGEICVFFNIDNIQVAPPVDQVRVPWLITPEGQFVGLNEILEFLSLRRNARLHLLRGERNSL